MQISIDAAGRVVIPKALRELLGLAPGVAIEATVDGGGLRLDPVRPSERPITERDGLPVLGFITGAVLTDAEVQHVRDASRR